MVQLSLPHVNTSESEPYSPQQQRPQQISRARSWSAPTGAMDISGDCVERPRLRLSISCPDASIAQLQSQVPSAPHGNRKRFFEDNWNLVDHLHSHTYDQVAYHANDEPNATIMQPAKHPSAASPTIPHGAQLGQGAHNCTPGYISSRCPTDQSFSPPTMRRKTMKSRKMTRRRLQWGSSQTSSCMDTQDKINRQQKWKLLRSITIAKRRGIIPSSDLLALGH